MLHPYRRNESKPLETTACALASLGLGYAAFTAEATGAALTAALAAAIALTCLFAQILDL